MKERCSTLHTLLAATDLALAIATTAGAAASTDPRWILPLLFWCISLIAVVRAVLALRQEGTNHAYDSSTLIMSLAFSSLALQLVVRLFATDHFGG
mgnify:CR=1 FL=1|jgi:hypothetical protein